VHFPPGSSEIRSFPEAKIIDLDIDTNKWTKRNSYLGSESHMHVSKKFLGSIRSMVQVWIRRALASKQDRTGCLFWFFYPEKHSSFIRFIST
jgi:hypothetical protein